MTDRRFTILSTGSMVPDECRPVKRNLPDSVLLEEIPFIQLILNPDAQVREQILSFARERQVVIFTSINAVRAVITHLHSKPDWNIYCVGNTTKKRAASFFGTSAISGTAGNADGLAFKIIQDGVKRAVFFCGDQRHDVLPLKLEEQGITLQELVVYQTQITPVAVVKDFDAILFFSPTAVTGFFSVNTIPARTVLFALGKTTAEALNRFTGNPVLLSPEPDKETLIQMAIAYGLSNPRYHHAEK